MFAAEEQMSIRRVQGRGREHTGSRAIALSAASPSDVLGAMCDCTRSFPYFLTTIKQAAVSTDHKIIQDFFSRTGTT